MVARRPEILADLQLVVTGAFDVRKLITSILSLLPPMSKTLPPSLSHTVTNNPKEFVQDLLNENCTGFEIPLPKTPLPVGKPKESSLLLIVFVILWTLQPDVAE
jgi:hypothetical protein